MTEYVIFNAEHFVKIDTPTGEVRFYEQGDALEGIDRARAIQDLEGSSGNQAP